MAVDAVPSLKTSSPWVSQRRLRLLIADDYEAAQLGLRGLFSAQTWVERCVPARSGAEAVARARRYRVDVALVNLFVGSESGLDVAARVSREVPETRVVLIGPVGRTSAEAARAAGAVGLLSTDLSAPDLLRSVHVAGLGFSVFATLPQGSGLLNERERAVLDLIAEGATNREIAGRLTISPDTVKGNVSQLCRKLGVRNRAEAVRRGQRLGLIS
jgi:DNA-binding NarL/FixJ family response regulator